MSLAGARAGLQRRRRQLRQQQQRRRKQQQEQQTSAPTPLPTSSVPAPIDSTHGQGTKKHKSAHSVEYQQEIARLSEQLVRARAREEAMAQRLLDYEARESSVSMSVVPMICGVEVEVAT